MLLRFLGFGVTLFAASIHAQMVATNWVKTWHKFRVVNGQVYDSEKSIKWDVVQGEFVERIPQGDVFKFAKTKEYRRRVDPILTENQRAGAYAGPNSMAQSV